MIFPLHGVLEQPQALPDGFGAAYPQARGAVVQPL